MIGMWSLVGFLDVFFFVLASFCVAYLFCFALASAPRWEYSYPSALRKHKFLVLFPAYKEDRVILESVRDFLRQDYPPDMFQIVVISDHMEEETNQILLNLPITLLRASYKNSSKAKALNFAVQRMSGQVFDVVVVLDADNTVEPGFLNAINNAYDAGSSALQAHRKAKNRDTPVAVLDALSEEINNSIFRKGHVRLGFSSALIGSGMAFDFDWFRSNISKVLSSGEDKEIEALLLGQGVFINYLDDVYVFDDKVKGESAFYQQRRRWLASQFYNLMRFIPDLPGAIYRRNWDYCDKLLQWMMPPRLLLLGGIFFFMILSFLLQWGWAIKWFFLLLLLMFSFVLATPDYLVDNNLRKAIRKLPVIFFLMLWGVFRVKGANKKFIHTQH